VGREKDFKKISNSLPVGTGNRTTYLYYLVLGGGWVGGISIKSQIL